LVFYFFCFFTCNKDFDFKINVTVCKTCEVTLSKKCDCVFNLVHHQ
jgi:hypothetical protein